MLYYNDNVEQWGMDVEGGHWPLNIATITHHPSRTMQTFLEYTMTADHKKKIADAHSHTTHTPATKRKIAKSMAGKKNHEGKTHSETAKRKISLGRGERDPIQGRHWIVNINNKTYRKHSTPIGWQPHRRHYKRYNP